MTDEEFKKEKKEEEIVMTEKPSRGQVSLPRSVAVSLPLSTPTSVPSELSSDGFRRIETCSELSPDVFQLRAPLVSLESLLLSPGCIEVRLNIEFILNSF